MNCKHMKSLCQTQFIPQLFLFPITLHKQKFTLTKSIAGLKFLSNTTSNLWEHFQSMGTGFSKKQNFF